MMRRFGAPPVVNHAIWPAARAEAWTPVERVWRGAVCDFCWKPIAGSAWLSLDRHVYEHLHCRQQGFEAEQQWREHVEAREAAIRTLQTGARQLPALEGFEQVNPRELVIDPLPELLEIDVRDYAGALALEGWAAPIGISPSRVVLRGDRQVVAAVFLGLPLVPVEVLDGEASVEEAA